MNVAIIPARYGSKGFPGKNTAEILGVACIEYTINAAVGSGIFDRIIITSNDEKIYEISKKFYVDYHQRPEMYCRDESSANDVINDLWQSKKIFQDDLICYLQPTSPLRNSVHIKEAFALYKKHQKPVVSVCETNEIPFKMFQLNDGCLAPLFDERLTNRRRQDLPKTYMVNGAIYIFTVTNFLSNGGFPSQGGSPYIMSQDASVDIDSPKDKVRIEKLLNGRM